MVLTEEHNINKNEIAYRFGTSADFGGECVFEIRAVYRKKDKQNWKLYSALIKKVGDACDAFSEQYEENSFFIIYVTFSKISHIILQLYEGGIEVSSDYPPIKLDVMKVWRETLIPSWCSHTNVPIRHLSFNLESRNYGDEQLVGYKLPYYQSFIERVSEFISYEKGDKNSVHLLLEDSRAILNLCDDQIVLSSESDVSLVGQIERGKDISKINFDTADFPPIDVKDSSSVELWAIGGDNLIYDYISSNAFPYRYELKKLDKTIEEHIQEKINNGETIDCEFKKFIDIDKGDSKSTEIDKTVCAFSNTDGGSLIIGVTDNGEIIGIDEDVRRKYQTTLDEAIVEYSDAISKRLYENLTINDCFTISKVELYGKKLIVVNVNESNGWNFLQASDVPYKRKGATNFNATRLVALDLESSNSKTSWMQQEVY